MHSSQIKHFNYIFTGTGLSTLMTVYKMVLSGKFNDKSILLLDESQKKINDRTWCFWTEKETMWNSIISKKWDSALFANEDFKRDLDLKPYQYNQIRGIDFYNFVFEVLSKESNITFLKEKVTDINELETHVFVGTEENRYTGDYLFNSIYTKTFVQSQTKYPVLQQHFVGWFVKSENEIFNSEKATFMDFSIEQRGNTRFMYVLPTSKTEALVEYTLFSENLLSKEEYEKEIQLYLQKLGADKFQIAEREQGSIPMTCYPFWKKNTKRVLNIGTAGGWTKASTGFTFRNSDKKSSNLVEFLQKENVKMTSFHKKSRFWFYDLLLLDILYRHNELGSSIFSSLFKKGNPALVFKFLDEETSLLQDVKVVLKCPKIPFIKALFRVIFFFQNKFNQKHQPLNKITLAISLFFTLFSFAQVSTNKAHDAIVEEFLTNCAEKHNYVFEMSEWQDCLDQGLKKDTTVAYLWQQKAMPYFKCKKYEVGMQYLDKAVFYNKKEWLPYRGFIKCIFAKTYKEAIIDLEECIKLYGNGYRMDHTYSFYMGICYLQLNEYKKAEKLFDDYVADIYKNRQNLEHPTAYFYQGIAKYELKKWEEAIAIFDKAIKIYPEFSDAKYYKAICLFKLGKSKEEVNALIGSAKEDASKGFSINEDNTIYETYPYQKKFSK